MPNITTRVEEKYSFDLELVKALALINSGLHITSAITINTKPLGYLTSVSVTQSKTEGAVTEYKTVNYSRREITELLKEELDLVGDYSIFTNKGEYYLYKILTPVIVKPSFWDKLFGRN